ncbi:hypothetical protein EDC65_2568 [Stella humosa]|uniref:Yip1-like protein n=1 Tax=Stella humosa TaxID=94 RepID=A0A3N1LH73_9PROT|nr:hypothetical protein [Stella humosa]ROP90712.1 hypothetical protein EDC65_2568 [Stella humosa]BBK29388.1 hypothetical protein STHU_00220 [Stella humosa]
MNIFQFLNSLDELLYELMSWFVFFPVTMWRLLRHPIATMRYAEEQLRLDENRQYRGTVSPPIMLILTVAVTQCIDLAVDNTNPIVTSHQGLAELISDNTSLFLLRLVLFGSFAILLATRKVQRSAVDLDRDSLKPAFYAQCYAIAPFALLVSSGTIALGHALLPVQVLGLTALVAAFLFYGAVQVRWFQQALDQSVFRSIVDAAIGMIGSFAITLGLALLFQ